MSFDRLSRSRNKNSNNSAPHSNHHNTSPSAAAKTRSLLKAATLSPTRLESIETVLKKGGGTTSTNDNIIANNVTDKNKPRIDASKRTKSSNGIHHVHSKDKELELCCGRTLFNSTDNNISDGVKEDDLNDKDGLEFNTKNYGRNHFNGNNTMHNNDLNAPDYEQAFNSNSTSNDEDNDLVIDVLPSFHLYNALHRHIPMGNVDSDIVAYPPRYEEPNTTSIINYDTNANNAYTSDTSSTGISIRPRLTRGHSSTDNISGQPNLHLFRTQYEPIIDDIDEDNENIAIDRVYSLPKLSTPIEISIKVTKTPVRPDQKLEEESILKEYTSGDIVNGYVIISNKSTERMKFEMFYVTLEGFTSVLDKKLEKRTIKRFLRMVDISASWSYSTIEISSGVEYDPGAIDPDDGCILGLPNNRYLEPGLKYKKYFMFKFPYQLLDVTCKHELSTHTQVPPSFGIDSYALNGKYSNIGVNPMLGYGHLGTKGSPILTLDLAPASVATHYSIDAKLVGKEPATSSLHLGPDANGNNNNSNNSCNKKLFLMKDAHYNLRFIPFGTPCNWDPILAPKSPLSQLKKLSDLIKERLKMLDVIFEKVHNNQIITPNDVFGEDFIAINNNEDAIANRDATSTDMNNIGNNDGNARVIPNTSYLESEEILNRKLRNLYVNRDDSTNTTTTEHYHEKGQTCHSHFINDTEDDNYKEGDIVKREFAYAIKSHSKSKKMNFFSAFMGASHSSSKSHANNPAPGSAVNSSSNTSLHKQPNSSNLHSGIIMASATIPQGGISYSEPSLLRKTNKFDNKNKHDQENWSILTKSLGDSPILKTIKINLDCVESNNSEDHCPPDIQAISIDLISITGLSTNPIPINLNSKFLLNDKKLEAIRKEFVQLRSEIDKYLGKFLQHKDNINKLYKTSITTLPPIKFNNFISNGLLSDVNSIANFNVEKKTLKEVFLKQSVCLLKEEKENSDNIKPVSTSTGLLSPSDSHGLAKNHASNTLTTKKSGSSAINQPVSPQISMKRTASSSLLSPFSSGNANSQHINELFKEFVVHEWIRVEPHHYKRELDVRLRITPELKQTLVPTFEECLCCRMYCLHVNIKFAGQAGIASIDIPVKVIHY
ncbi:ubiquitin-ubiquitin ligase BUL2 SCDLUD_001273 [Saccharomycodes ludwigii]|uniref:ubiquitin-ubiquitin ligase BUL2 n=1 Tax=Saccharomycodes ludwigii TaxID=36035 RepID=UPI001E8612E9|nr:hypothetical protein SCDLUD_001273 [Saccharomycodes ludwigii]KAH3903628.1 hypothetical protein SCDLUD_001273 [Saccharomycodes ludwigii]